MATTAQTITINQPAGKTAFTVFVDDTILDNTLAAEAWKGGWQAEVTDNDPNSKTYGQTIPNPVTVQQAAIQHVGDQIISDTTDYMNMQALQAVQAPANSLITPAA